MRVFPLMMVALLASACLRTGGESPASTASTEEACSCDSRRWPAPPAGGTPREGGEVSIRISSEPGTLLSMYSPHEVIEHVIDHNVLESLVAKDSPSGHAIPQLATSWDIEEPTGTYTFHLDPNAAWHDGEPFTGRDVEFTFDLLLDPAGGALNRNDFLDVESVESVDDHTVVIRLDRARPDFVLSLARISILPEHVFGKEVVSNHPASRAPIGTGPFVFSKWKRGLSITIEANRRWRGTPPHVDRIVYRLVPERRVAMDLFRGGELDIVTESGATVDELEPGATLVTYPMSRFECLVYNVTRPYFAEPEVRRALASLIDRDAIRCSIRGCLAEIIDDPWPPSTDAHRKSPWVITYDPVNAMRALDEAGWIDRDGDGTREKDGVPLAFSVLFLDSQRDLRRALTLIRWDFARAGIDMRLVPIGSAVLADRLRKHRFDAAMMAAPNSSPFDPFPYFHTVGAETGRNFGLFSNTEIDGLIEDLSREAAPAIRRSLVYELDRTLSIEQPVTFTFRPHGAAIVRGSIRGVRIGEEWFEERYLWIDKGGGG